MGILYEGTPLGWEEGQKHADYIREHGITQFLNIWNSQKNRRGDKFLWGDEVSFRREGFEITSLIGPVARVYCDIV
jgi:glutamate--cysteine ligase catalytic subunit